LRTGVIVGLVGAVLGTAALGAGAYYGLGRLQSGNVESRAGALQKSFEVLGVNLRYEGIASGGATAGLALDNVRLDAIEGASLSAERLTVERWDWRNAAAPRYGALALLGVRATPDVLGEELGRIVADAKVKEMKLDLLAEFSYDAEAKILTVTGIKAVAHGLGIATLEFTLLDWVPQPKARAGRRSPDMPAIVHALGERAAVKVLALRFEDQGLTRAYVSAHAERIGKSETNARNEIVNALRKEFAQRRDRFGREAIQLLINHVRRPGVLTLAAEPPQPVPLNRVWATYVANPGSMMDRFNIRLGAR
jgi:hypothetical protein